MSLVLDHGEVRLLRAMAEDLDVVGSARVSTALDPEVASKGGVSDERLVSFLMTNGHGSPFEHAVFRWYVRAPIFVFREWQRHRIGSFNEQSGRYAKFQAVFYVPDRFRVQHPTNKQSSVPTEDDDLNYTAQCTLRNVYGYAFDKYEELLAAGVAREQARLVLPGSLYSSMWWTVNARALMNFLMLRNHDAAQWEIRQYAIALEEVFAQMMPWTHAAFVAAGRRAP